MRSLRAAPACLAVAFGLIAIRLRSIADRLGALGSRLEIDGKAGAGPSLTAEIPCG
jgi:hypothetical protein